jgi:cytochrome c-type biogenesis protein CcmE
MTPGYARAEKAKTRRFAIVALVLAGGAVSFAAFGGLGDNLVYYWGPSDLVKAGDEAQGATIRLGGQVAKGSIQYRPGDTELRFAITDGSATVPVHALGVPPQMFREEIGVIVEGTMGPSGVFQGRRVMVSHGNEYRAPKPGESVDVRAMMRSAEGLEPEP